MFGKLFGGAFGFMVGGPVGAMLGAVVGHNFDRKTHGGDKRSAATSPEHEAASARSHDLFLTTTFQIMGHIAKVDGRVSEREIAVARTIMGRLRLDTRQRRAAIDDFTAGKQAGFDLDAALREFKNACRSRPALLQQLLELLLNVAYADDALHPHTLARLLHITDRLGVHRLQFEAMHTLFRAQHWAQQQHQGGTNSHHRAGNQGRYGRHSATTINSLEQAYTMLGLKREARPDEIKLAYRRLLKQHHPDKLAGRNASVAELARATEKTRELTAAYDRIREARGF